MARQFGRRILLCADKLPPSDGGVEQVVQKLALHLAEEWYEVGVFTLDDGSREFNLVDNPDVSFYTASAINLTDTIGLQSMFSLSALREFGNVLDTFQPDIVHAHNRFFYTSALAALYSLRADYELVTTLHLGDIGIISGVGGVAARTFEQTVSRFVISRSDHVICVSAAAESIARSLSATRTTVIQNGVDIKEFTPAPADGKQLLYIGRLVRNNGIKDLLTALPGVMDAHPDLTVDIVGSGPLEAEVQKTIRQAKLSDAVTVHDYVPDITAMYDRASVFCRPSYSEGLPLTMLEAMASGVPPVMTAVAGVPEVVTDRETGLLLEPERPDEIEAALTELFDNDPFRTTLAENARDYIVNNLTWEQRTQEVTSVYQRYW